mgnify:CR=1 FL=1
MSQANPEAPKTVKHKVRNRIMSGLFLLVPLAVTLAVMEWLFRWMAGFLGEPIVWAMSFVVDEKILAEYGTYINVGVSAVSILGLLLLLYMVGTVGHFVMGKRLISAGEKLLLRIPIVRFVYGSTKQVMQALSMQDKAAFQSVVLVEFPRPGFKCLAFLTGYTRDARGKTWCRLFIPTTPNPTTGYFELAPIEDVLDAGMAVEDAFKMIMSGGILAPDVMDLARPLREPAPAEPPLDGDEEPADTEAPAHWRRQTPDRQTDPA